MYYFRSRPTAPPLGLEDVLRIKLLSYVNNKNRNMSLRPLLRGNRRKLSHGASQADVSDTFNVSTWTAATVREKGRVRKGEGFWKLGVICLRGGPVFEDVS